MAKDSFIKSLHELLEDRADSIDFSKVSLDYKKSEERIEKLYEQIKPLLNENGENLLLKYEAEHNGRMTKAAEISYQKGFAEGIKLIIYSLIIS